jgi:hypothetical protein
MEKSVKYFKGYDEGCHFCELFKSAKKNHICNRGKRFGYKSCGTTIQEDVAENSTSTNKDMFQLLCKEFLEIGDSNLNDADLDKSFAALSDKIHAALAQQKHVS